MRDWFEMWRVMLNWVVVGDHLVNVVALSVFVDFMKLVLHYFD